MDNTDFAAGGDVQTHPALTRNAIARLRDSGDISASAFERALDFCGFIPGRDDWITYWRQIFLLGGALLCLAGVIFFIAWNWAEMHRFVRMACVGVLVAFCGVGALVKGFDTRLGQVLLLSCGIAIGPMLAVFGQTYQTGAELWELFRIWTALLILFAIAGKQAGLWFAAWLSGNVFVMLWLGRNMNAPLEALGMFTTLPECLLALFTAVAAWEWAAWKLRATPAYFWLHSRWLPRLLFFDLTCRITIYLVWEMFRGYFREDMPALFLPHSLLIPALGLLLAGASWYWHRRKTPDLFMLAIVLSSLTVLFLSFLVKIEFLFRDGVFGVFIWSLLITGITAGLGKILVVLQHSLKNEGQSVPRNTHIASGFLGCFQRDFSWGKLWAELQEQGLLEAGKPLPVAKEPGNPWYVQCLLAFGGWVAAILFVAVCVLLLFDILRIRMHEDFILFLVSVPIVASGGVALKRPGIFLHHLGFALALAGAGCAIGGTVAMLDGGRASFFLISVFLAAACIFVESGAFRFLAAAAVSLCMATGLATLGYWGRGHWFDLADLPAFTVFWASCASALWWAALGMAFVFFHLREKEWRGTLQGKIAEPAFFGMFAGMLLSQIIALSFRFNYARGGALFFGNARGVALGAAAGLIYFAWMSSRNRNDDAGRLFIMSCAAVSLPLAWFLPGAALAFFGLAVARFIGNIVMQGVIAAYFFVYMVYYYYFLGISLLAKSLLLAATGVLLLLFAYCLGKYAAGVADGEGRRA